MASGVRGKPKRVTDPLDDRAKARLFGEHLSWDLDSVSSGSDHSAAASASASADNDYSPCLSNLVSTFLEGARDESAAAITDSDSDNNESASEFAADSVLKTLLLATRACNSFSNLLRSQVSTAVSAFSSATAESAAALRRRVMVFLRNLGHNAAICKSKWPGAENLAAGSYEFIDFIDAGDSSPNRFIIDLNFISEFEIARPTDRYSQILQSLPRIYVGRAADLKRIVKIVADEAKRSLKCRGLHLPPWRRSRYMQNKWLGPHRRTVNPAPSTAISLPHAAVKCRSVGFDAAGADNGRFFCAAATARTR